MAADVVTLVALLGSGLAFAAAAAVALGWAVRARQFDNPARDARAIFDADEPVGTVTDTALRPRPRE